MLREIKRVSVEDIALYSAHTIQVATVAVDLYSFLQPTDKVVSPQQIERKPGTLLDHTVACEDSPSPRGSGSIQSGPENPCCPRALRGTCPSWIH